MQGCGWFFSEAEAQPKKKYSFRFHLFLKNWIQIEQLFYRQLFFQKNIMKNLFTFCRINICYVLSGYLKNATNNISSMFYLRTSSLRHKIMQDNFGSGSSRVGSDWESRRFRIIWIIHNCTCNCNHCNFNQITTGTVHFHIYNPIYFYQYVLTEKKQVH